MPGLVVLDFVYKWREILGYFKIFKRYICCKLLHSGKFLILQMKAGEFYASLIQPARSSICFAEGSAECEF